MKECRFSINLTLVLFVIAVIEAVIIGFMDNKIKCDEVRKETLQMLSEEYPILVGNYEYIIKEYGISPDDSQIWSDIQVTKYKIKELIEENGLCIVSESISLYPL